MLIPLAIGIALGGAIAFTLQLSGMAKKKSSATVTLVAIAAFYPVFAAKNGDLKNLILHTTIMAVFIACAWAGFLWSATIIAIGLIAHGLFDLLMLKFESPVPFFGQCNSNQNKRFTIHHSFEPRACNFPFSLSPLDIRHGTDDEQPAELRCCLHRRRLCRRSRFLERDILLK